MAIIRILMLQSEVTVPPICSLRNHTTDTKLKYKELLQTITDPLVQIHERQHLDSKKLNQPTPPAFLLCIYKMIKLFPNMNKPCKQIMARRLLRAADFFSNTVAQRTPGRAAAFAKSKSPPKRTELQREPPARPFKCRMFWSRKKNSLKEIVTLSTATLWSREKRLFCSGFKVVSLGLKAYNVPVRFNRGYHQDFKKKLNKKMIFS